MDVVISSVALATTKTLANVGFEASAQSATTVSESKNAKSKHLYPGAPFNKLMILVNCGDLFPNEESYVA